MNVSDDGLSTHYDFRDKMQKLEQRRKYPGDTYRRGLIWIEQLTSQNLIGVPSTGSMMSP